MLVFQFNHKGDKDMKKGTIIGKKQITLAVMVVGLAVAVWLNMKYSAASGKLGVKDGSSRIPGQTEFVNIGTGSDETVAVSANAYFTNARANRDDTRKENIDMLKETIANVKTDDSAKKSAVDRLAAIAAQSEHESAIESLVKAKGFSDSIAVIGDDSVNVIVEADKLLDSEVQQIKDIVISETGVSIEKIKILNVK